MPWAAAHPCRGPRTHRVLLAHLAKSLDIGRELGLALVDALVDLLHCGGNVRERHALHSRGAGAEGAHEVTGMKKGVKGGERGCTLQAAWLE